MPANHAEDITEILVGHVSSRVGAQLLIERLRASADCLADEFRVATIAGASPALLVELLVALDDEQFTRVLAMEESVLDLADEALAARPPPNLATLITRARIWALPRTVRALLDGGDPETLARLAHAPDAAMVAATLLELRVERDVDLSRDDTALLLACEPSELYGHLEDCPALAHVRLDAGARAELVYHEAWELLGLLSATDEECRTLLEHARTDSAALATLLAQRHHLHPCVADRVVDLAGACLARYGSSPAPRAVGALASRVLHERLATSVDMFVDAVIQESHLLYSGSLPPEANPSGSWRALSDLVNARAHEVPSRKSFAPVGLHLVPGDLERIRARLMRTAKTATAIDQLLRHVVREATLTPSDPQFAEFVDLCWALGNPGRVAHLDGGPAWMAAHLDATLGEDRHRWETFFNLMNSWTLTLSELLETATQITHNFDDQTSGQPDPALVP